VCSQSHGFSGATHQPPGTNEQIERITEESRLIAFDQVTNELNTQPTTNKPSAHFQLKKNNGSDTTIMGMPIECESLFSGWRCLDL